jgi:hypothetical protein
MARDRVRNDPLAGIETAQQEELAVQQAVEMLRIHHDC